MDPKQRPSPKDFVRVAGDGFVVGEADLTFKFVGCNSYILLENAAKLSTIDVVDDLLDTAMYAGLTVLRMWAFCDGDYSWALQKEPGVLDEENCVNLDYVLIAAAERGIKLILVLTNYWSCYGGLQQYVRWARPDKSRAKSDDFYENGKARRYFTNYMRAIVNRVNSISGVRYKDDPSIFAWSVINEPRCEYDKTCTVVKEFIDTSAKFIKSLDKNHLVTFGSEGFFGSSTPDLLRYNPFNASEMGVDFCSDATSPGIDFASVHLWMDDWRMDRDKDFRENFVNDWISSHLSAGKSLLKKPVVLTEFGTRGNKITMYRQVFENLTGEGIQQKLPGALFWHLATPDFASVNHYAICYSEEIEEELKALGKPGEGQSKPILEEPGTKATNGATEGLTRDVSWQILKLCWQVARQIARESGGTIPHVWTMRTRFSEGLGCFLALSLGHAYIHLIVVLQVSSGRYAQTSFS